MAAQETQTPSVLSTLTNGASLSRIKGRFKRSWLYKHIDKLVLQPLQRDPERLLKYVVKVALVVGIVMSLLPMPVLNWLRGVHWTKVYPLVYSIQSIRSTRDFVYAVLVTRLSFIYNILHLAWMLAVFPLTLLKRLFGDLNRLRTIIVMVSAPLIVLMTVRKIHDRLWVKRMRRKSLFADVTSTRGLLLMTVLTSILFMLFIILAYLKFPTLYMFCFDDLSPETAIMLHLASAFYTHMAVLLLVDSIRAGRREGYGPNDVKKKQETLGAIVAAATIMSYYALASINRGYFARTMMLDSRLCALE